jgi:hypothetical protein
MRTLGGFVVVLVAAGGLMAQNRGGFVNTGAVRTFGNVLFPGGTSNIPGIQRTTGNVLFPGGGNQIGIPFAPSRIGISPRQGAGGGARFRQDGRRGGSIVTAYPIVYPYPVYVGGDGYYDPYGAAPAPPPQQPNVTVIMPPQAPPVVINQFGPGVQPVAPNAAYQPPPPAETAPAAESQPLPDAPHYLIAFTDHTVYAAIAYWVDGDTLHYFTSGNTHNQVSVSLIDRALTERLNRESGLQVNLPPAK